MDRSVPTYEDAQLILKLYELRRDEKMRAAREWFAHKFFPTTIEDVKTVQASTGHENAYYRMVTSYWEMAASFVARGVLNLDLFLDSGGEMLFLWAKLEYLVGEIRAIPGSENFLVSVEKVVKSSPRAQDRVRKNRERMAPKHRAPAPAAR
jgi:hypothetical protein